MSYDFSNSKILVIGDLMLDIFYYGKSFRESPEAPVPVIEDADIRNILGDYDDPKKDKHMRFDEDAKKNPKKK